MCQWIHVTEAALQLLVKIYQSSSNIKEDSGRRDEGREKRKRGESHLGRDNQAGAIKQIS